MFNTRLHPDDSRAIYNKAASGWHHRINALGYPGAYRAAIDALLPADMPVHRLMDAGCGAGDFAAAYLQMRPRPDVLTLADPAAAMLHEAAVRLQGAADQVLLLEGVLNDLPMHPSQDLILCAHVIDHCPDPVLALRALARSLTARGAILLIATKPHWCTRLIRWVWRTHQVCWSASARWSAESICSCSCLSEPRLSPLQCDWVFSRLWIMTARRESLRALRQRAHCSAR